MEYALTLPLKVFVRFMTLKDKMSISLSTQDDLKEIAKRT